MRKFTKDNWKIDMSSCVSNECMHTFIYPEHLRIKQIDEDVHIALARMYEDDKGSYDECYANARLIAAAPKMYERLKLLARLISRQAQGQLRENISPDIAQSIYELLAEIDNEPAETMKYSSSFFQNRNCEYFPCHQVEDTENFNCMFCFCPLYHMKNCSGNPCWLSNGVKDCSGCTLPHRDYNAVISMLKEEAKDVH